MYTEWWCNCNAVSRIYCISCIRCCSHIRLCVCVCVCWSLLFVLLLQLFNVIRSFFSVPFRVLIVVVISNIVLLFLFDFCIGCVLISIGRQISYNVPVATIFPHRITTVNVKTLIPYTRCFTTFLCGVFDRSGEKKVSHPRNTFVLMDLIVSHSSHPDPNSVHHIPLQFN